MTTRVVLAFLVLVSLVLPPWAEAGRRGYEWDEVPQELWGEPSEDDSLSADDYIVFEKVCFDHKQLADDKAYTTVYRRIRIRSQEGRQWGDVVIPHYRSNQKVEKVHGRTLLPDGTAIILEKDQIFERELLKSRGRKVKQKAFSLPGVTDDCIIEYYYKIKTSEPVGVWQVQRSIPLKHGELRWEVFGGAGLTAMSYALNRARLSPNYIWLNTDRGFEVERLPSPEKCEEVRFTIADVPPLEAEPHALADIARQTQVHCYYSSPADADDYWGGVAIDVVNAAEQFCEQKERLDDVIVELDTLSDRTSKILAAYEWVLANVRNASYETDIDDPESHASVDDALNKGYANRAEINLIFCGLLRALGIEARLAMVTDRDERLFVRRAKYWQFDRFLVAVRTSANSFEYYSPGDACLVAGQVPWYNEGITALLCGVIIDQFQAVPFSEPEQNRLWCALGVTLSPEGGARGQCMQKEWGHPARKTKLLCLEDTEAGARASKSDRLKERLGATELSNLEIVGCRGSELPVRTTFDVQYAYPNAPAMSRWLVNPFEFMGSTDNPFTSSERVSPVVFDFAFETAEQVNLSIPEGWEIRALPTDTSLVSPAGICRVSFSALGNMVSIKREFRLADSYYSVAEYDAVRQLFEARAQFSKLSILLQEL